MRWQMIRRWPILFRRDQLDHKWPFLTGFAITRSFIYNFSHGRGEEGGKNSEFVQRHGRIQLVEDTNLRQAITNQTDMSLLIAKHLWFIESKDANLVFSPLSIQVILSQIAVGSTGRTQDQLLRFLKSLVTYDLNKLYSQPISLVLTDASRAGGPKLRFANGVWIDETIAFKSNYKQILDRVYKANSYRVDFSDKQKKAAYAVNTWVKKQTNGLIKNMIHPGLFGDYTLLILVNAVYFKGAWDAEFDASKTKDHDFHLVDGTSVKVPFMTTKESQLIRSFDGFKVLGLPYKQGEDHRKFSMYVFLPDKKDGLSALIDRLGLEHGFLEQHLPYSFANVGEFKLPRFKISFCFEASKVLEGLHLVSPFEVGGLTKMVDPVHNEMVSVDSILHKVFIEVNEKGTEAAATTEAQMTGCSRFPDKVVDFVADHPFTFVIREDTTGAVMFVGMVMNPLASLNMQSVRVS